MTLAQARAQGVTPKRGGTLTSLLTPEPAVLILGVNSQAPTLICASKIYQSLFEFSPKRWNPSRCWPSPGRCPMTRRPTRSSCKRT